MAFEQRDDLPNTNFSICRCECSEEAIDLNSNNGGHVHCPCEVCDGRPVYRMKAWRHVQSKASRQNLENDIDMRDDDGHDQSTALPEEELDITFDSETELVTAGVSYEESHSNHNSELEEIETATCNEDNDNGPHRDQDDFENRADDVLDFIRDAVLNLVDLKTKVGFSIQTFEDLLKWGKTLHCIYNEERKDKWPSSWEDVRILLEKIGYCHPKLYFFCLNSAHPCLFGLMESKCELCPYCGKQGTIPYYYLSAIDKVKRWFTSPEMCHNISAHWRERDHWLPQDNQENWGWPLKKEIWDGKKFARLAYFWDPDCEWVLPVRCPADGCQNIISAEMLLQCPLVVGDPEKRNVECPSCFNFFEHTPQKTKGDPRNLAYDAHWDGWQPFSSMSRGSGAIELQIATMSKELRCTTEEVYVVGFVPSYLLPNKAPISLDPFLAPLIQDIENGFIDGIQVNCSASVCGKPDGPAVIRHLILCFSGDHNGVCEVGKFIKMGKCGCRRCKLESIYIADICHYYYPNFRKQGRFPSEKKSILSNLDMLCDIAEEERITIRKKKARDSGYTGLSILHRLYPLYGFCYDEHIVYDEMHTISLNIVKSALLDLLNDEDSGIDWNIVDQRLNNMAWTSEFKSSRYPRNLTKSIGYWKAEEFSIFAYPISEVVFDGLLTQEQKEEWCCLARIVEFIQNHARNGWREEDAETFHVMALRYAVLLEERRGTTKCVIILHNLLHLREDIQNFSGLDNYSCWTKERAVRRYVNQSSNCKNIEATFASTEVRRECLKAARENETVVTDPCKVDTGKVWAKSIDQAKKLYKINPTIDCQGNGIHVGGATPILLPVEMQQAISLYSRVPQNQVGDGATSYRSIWKPKHLHSGLLYRVKEHIVAIIPIYGEIVVQLSLIFTVNVEGHMKSFFTAQQFKEVGFSDMGGRLVQRSDDTVTAPLTAISRKIMLAKCEHDIAGLPTFIVVDFMRRLFPITFESVVVPYYPVINDMVLVRGNQQDDVWRARVLSFRLARKVITGSFFMEQNVSGVWVPERTRNQEIHFNSILGVVTGRWLVQFSQSCDN